ncbi:ferrous iron transport protein A [Chloroflexota bacterium]
MTHATGENTMTLQAMPSGRCGRVVSVEGGRGLVERLSAMGLRTGQAVTKMSSMVMRGPVTVQVGSTQIALGYGMARKIIVSLESKK